MKKRQFKKKITSKRIKRNEKIKNKIRLLVLEAEKMEKVCQEEQAEREEWYYRGNAHGLYEALCLINDGRW